MKRVSDPMVWQLDLNQRPRQQLSSPGLRCFSFRPPAHVFVCASLLNTTTGTRAYRRERGTRWPTPFCLTAVLSCFSETQWGHYNHGISQAPESPALRGLLPARRRPANGSRPLPLCHSVPQGLRGLQLCWTRCQRQELSLYLSVNVPFFSVSACPFLSFFPAISFPASFLWWQDFVLSSATLEHCGWITFN